MGGLKRKLLESKERRFETAGALSERRFGVSVSLTYPLLSRMKMRSVKKELLISQFDKLLPLAVKWASAVEVRILHEGVRLSKESMADAHALGVREPERVRLLTFARVPLPDDLTLRTAAAAIQFLTPATRGLTLRYGIFIRQDCWGDRRLVAHELVHTAQYERLGGTEPFLRQYLLECLRIGYPAAPLEQEAIALTGRLGLSELA